MKIYRGDSDFRGVNPVVTVGVFDGVHQGHTMLLDYLCSRSRDLGGESVVVTFDPHPQLVLNADAAGQLLFLTSEEEKLLLLERQGIDNVVILNFTRELAALSACEFAQSILHGSLGMKHLVAGFNNGFGNRSKSDFDSISVCGAELGFTVERAGRLQIGEGAVSSTKIRNLLLAGDVAPASELLGYNYFVKGIIVEGRQLGRSIGFPTANVASLYPNKLIPGDGVYVVTVSFDGVEYRGMANIGVRPTVDRGGGLRSVEVHIFDFSETIYGQPVTLHFLSRLRDEMRFGSVEELRQQLVKDRERAIGFFA